MQPAVKRRSRQTARIVAGGITIVVAVITLAHTGSASGPSRFQIIPFTRKVDGFLCMIAHCMSRRHWLYNFLIDSVGNVAIFVPFGASVFIALRDRRHALRTATLLGLGLSILFETIQIWIPGRVIATDDLLLNTLGTAIGAWFAYITLVVYRAVSAPARVPDYPSHPPANKGN